MPTLRVIYDPPAAGDWNMAVDEALAESVGQGGPATLRFYGWSPATLSIGYFQSAVDRVRHPASASCPLVRRASGGGAILHDRELTYALVLPAEFSASRGAAALYRTVHSVLRDVLATFGIQVQLRETPDDRFEQRFLCFQRRAEGDVLCKAVKVGGSAQRRHARAVVQHGSVLLQQSEFAPELPGLEELAGVTMSASALSEAWAPVLAERLALTPAVGEELSATERESAEQIRVSKFADRDWNTRR